MGQLQRKVKLPEGLSTVLQKGTQGFICCLFKAVFSATFNKQMLSSLAKYDALSLVNHKDQLHLVWLRIVDTFTASVNSW